MDSLILDSSNSTSIDETTLQSTSIRDNAHSVPEDDLEFETYMLLRATAEEIIPLASPNKVSYIENRKNIHATYFQENENIRNLNKLNRVKVFTSEQLRSLKCQARKEEQKRAIVDTKEDSDDDLIVDYSEPPKISTTLLAHKPFSKKTVYSDKEFWEELRQRSALKTIQEVQERQMRKLASASLRETIEKEMRTASANDLNQTNNDGIISDSDEDYVETIYSDDDGDDAAEHDRSITEQDSDNGLGSLINSPKMDTVHKQSQPHSEYVDIEAVVSEDEFFDAGGSDKEYSGDDENMNEFIVRTKSRGNASKARAYWGQIELEEDVQQINKLHMDIKSGALKKRRRDEDNLGDLFSSDDDSVYGRRDRRRHRYSDSDSEESYHVLSASEDDQSASHTNRVTMDLDLDLDYEHSDVEVEASKSFSQSANIMTCDEILDLVNESYVEHCEVDVL
ncbi:652_t:CDS:2 [Paraglomus occultum]|uniref:652_t:CDS:1 n=1 Tax=Paraglomus occultum TaxID=144539 RepID=A0A9N8YX08_9GLOM|nr:652_t:CDS:2 [Paraglomus occultum]